MQTVYVDLYFLINFSMDFLCLYLTAKILSLKMNVFRGLAAAIIGGIYANLILLLTFPAGISLIFDGIAGLIIVITAYGKHRAWGRLPLYFLVYTGVSMALGGAMTALFYLFNRTGIFSFIFETDKDGLTVWLFALLAGISGIITLFCGRGFVRKTSVREVEVEITLLGRTASLYGIADSGNLLLEPISGRPCIVADPRGLFSILPSELSGIRGTSVRPGDLDRLSVEIKKRISLIPMISATGRGVALGIRADRIVIRVGEREREADAIVALSDGVSGAIVPTCLII